MWEYLLYSFNQKGQSASIKTSVWSGTEHRSSWCVERFQSFDSVCWFSYVFALFFLFFFSFPCTKYSMFYPRNTISNTTFISLQGWTKDLAWSTNGLQSTIVAHESPLDPGKHLDIWKAVLTPKPMSSRQRRHSWMDSSNCWWYLPKLNRVIVVIEPDQ